MIIDMNSGGVPAARKSVISHKPVKLTFYIMPLRSGHNSAGIQ